MFFIDDMFLRTLGISIPPFDMIWIMELLEDYVYQIRGEENQKKINNSLKENRLLYELGEITRDEFDAANGQLNHQRKINTRENGLNPHFKIDILNL